MISSLRGTVLSARGSLAVLDVHGVGYAVNVTPQHALEMRVGDETTLSTVLIVREDSLTLYGFPDEEQLEIFELLIGVTGVGPKSALGVLGAVEPDRIAQAVADEDDAVFRKVSGIGPKTAKLIILSLAGKVSVRPRAARGSGPAATAAQNVLAALIGLGWPERTASEVVDEILLDAQASDAANVQALLRLALARLGPAARS
ncbi:Holliday junction branch migration protein RuvA [Rathayibacter rathayi]|uniref:Holliday junction branch migration complex subunit RuvA n=1 Tax=Rathayibacter rathayi TaxID=33887 RepID=A0ABD6WC34_RATRA|nr:Holliday junction branch migration protein RuvA [Rathayibacter rathayi]AZZ48650.1 Holliday junction branch migration protein RuvA [Rathayibacter rathayi]MWV74982.1 Holliday junction branch migration protein RuvA [Rathayibacter rathayi NCPPB 2980 = VKM Ac-1601]PPF15812.1 Holliday junction branch migration protein RuvA [Rathayibacter rathayi]PPF25258.1 Holliday junction branch migration protein RuvA [Rathayibacter rathayi]PPF45112.1 Holliday junction branch migration protein RuvA [Rathayibact